MLDVIKIREGYRFFLVMITRMNTFLIQIEANGHVILAERYVDHFSVKIE